MDPNLNHQFFDLPASAQFDTPLHRYVNAFNGRNQLAMASILQTTYSPFTHLSLKPMWIALNPS